MDSPGLQQNSVPPDFLPLPKPRFTGLLYMYSISVGGLRTTRYMSGMGVYVFYSVFTRHRPRRLSCACCSLYVRCEC